MNFYYRKISAIPDFIQKTDLTYFQNTIYYGLHDSEEAESQYRYSQSFQLPILWRIGHKRGDFDEYNPLRSSQPAQKKPTTRSLPTRNFDRKEFDSSWSKWGMLVFQLAGSHWAGYATNSWCYRSRKLDAIASCKTDQLFFFPFCPLVNTVRNAMI